MEVLMNNLVGHVENISMGSVLFSRMYVYFKIDVNDEIIMLYC